MEEQLISVIEGFPELCNFQDPNYKDLYKKEKAWRDVTDNQNAIRYGVH